MTGPAQVQAGTWTMVPAASSAAFTVRDKLVSTVHGTFPVRSGVVVLGAAGAVARVRVELDVAGVSTGNARRDTDLAKHHLLDSASHPVLVVEAGPTQPGIGSWLLAATLHARGAASSLTVEATPTAYEGERVRVHVTGRFDRSGLGMKVPSFIIGRYLDLDVDALFERT